MGTVHYSWLTPSRIGQIKFAGDLSVEEVTEAHQYMFDHFLTPGTKPVHLIFDIEQVGTMPTNIIQMYQVNRQILTHPALGWLVVVGNKGVMQRFLVSTISQMFKAHIRMVATMDEALATLKKLDPTLTY